ncbi:MAG: hypothetical protein PUE95_04700 [Lachnospiraceae bacterium]|nr:hypothetical protein [Lachnospiraceae bacterium]
MCEDIFRKIFKYFVRIPDDVESLEKIYDALIGNRLKGNYA